MSSATVRLKEAKAYVCKLFSQGRSMKVQWPTLFISTPEPPYRHVTQPSLCYYDCRV